MWCYTYGSVIELSIFYLYLNASGKGLGGIEVKEVEESVDKIVQIFTNIPRFENCDKKCAQLSLTTDGSEPDLQKKIAIHRLVNYN